MSPHLIAPDGNTWAGKRGYLKTYAPMVAKGLVYTALLAVLFLICVRLGGIERELKARTANEAIQAAARSAGQELAKERYETEMREMNALRVSLNTLSAWYQEDARNQYRNRR